MRVLTVILICAVLFVLFVAYFIVSLIFDRCKPNCNGTFCGPSSDGCGGECECKSGGECMQNSVGKYICCYTNCNGLTCGDDGCGGTCSCNRLPNGTCNNGKCCYGRTCDNVYGGPTGCNDSSGNPVICACQEGAAVSNQNICANEGVSGWSWNIIKSNGVARSNVSSPLECSGWDPSNIGLDLTSFPCNTLADCPYGNTCVADNNGNKFCNRNEMFQWWYFDPTDPSGYNCAKIRQGSSVCGVQKEEASGFDIVENKGPNELVCGFACDIGPICPSSGPESCCPENWTQMSENSSMCNDQYGITQCCLNNPNTNDYQACITSGKPSCEDLDNVWWKANIGQIDSTCDASVTGGFGISNAAQLSSANFLNPCKNSDPGDVCIYNDGTTTYSGLCKNSSAGVVCLPNSFCVQGNTVSAGTGICTTGSL